jgi:hypothetical protein
MSKKSTLYLVLLAGVLAAGSLFAFAIHAQPVSQHVTLTGYVSCTTCLTPNACKAQTRLGCTEWWVNQGAAYVLVAGDRHYRLAGMEDDLLKAAAKNSVTISGEFDGTEVTVTNVDLAQARK